MKNDRSLALAVIFPLLTSGCFEVDDLKSVEAKDAATEEDASNEAKPDGGEPSFDDAGQPDAQTGPTGPCSETSCAEGQVCAPSGVCIERCTDAGVCVVAATKRIVTGLMTDGPVLYVALSATSDRYGNQAPDAELRTVIGDGELTLLTTLPENAERLESHGEHVYWTGTRPDTASRKFRRVAKRAVSGPEALYASANVQGNILLDDTTVAIRQPDGIYVGSTDGTTELRKVQDCPAVAQGFEDLCLPMALRGDELFYLRAAPATAFDNAPVALTSVDLVTAERKEYGGAYHDAKFLAVDPPYLYLSATSYGTQQMIYRRDLRDLTIPDFTMWLGLSPYFSYADGRAIQKRGDWVYVLAAESIFGNGEHRKRMVFERMAAVGPVNVQSLLPETFGTPLTDLNIDFALTDTHAFVAVKQTAPTGTLGSLIYRVPLPH